YESHVFHLGFQPSSKGSPGGELLKYSRLCLPSSLDSREVQVSSVPNVLFSSYKEMIKSQETRTFV
uniref:Uncharacterized protein n=1 Tax=Anas platyrhynchos platyrhynchos TaxID=8840 RepID=A0A493SXM1_ANAPP